MAGREDLIRQAVRSVFGESVTWVEPGRGGTVGAADCWLPIRGAWIGAELKDGEAVGAGVRFDMRPAQRRWHHRAAKEGAPSCVLIRLGDDVLGLQGARYPLTQRDACFSGLSSLKSGVRFIDRTVWEGFIWPLAMGEENTIGREPPQ